MSWFKPREHLYWLKGVKSQDEYYGICRTLRRHATKDLLVQDGGEIVEQFLIPKDGIAVQISRAAEGEHRVHFDYVALSLGKRFVKPDYISSILENRDAEGVGNPSTDIKNFLSLDKLVNS